jgi:hypothetical protein
MAVKKISKIGGGGILRRTHAKRMLNWMRKDVAPTIDDVFGLVGRPSKSAAVSKSINVVYILGFESPRGPQFSNSNLFALLRVVVDFPMLRQLQKILGKRSWGELTPDLVLLDPKTRCERGRLHCAQFIDADAKETRQGRFGPGLYETDLLGASWRPVPGFAFDNPIPVLKMWGDKRHGR